MRHQTWDASYSKERRVDPQVVVGLLVDRNGFPLEIGCYEGSQAETATIIPIVKQFQDRHHLADMVVVADAGMLSATNLRELDEADLRFIVGSRATKAPIDLASHFRWHGDAFADGQVIDTLTPKNRRVIENDSNLKTEPAWDPEQHPASWRAVWTYSTKRAAQDNKTLTAQENRAKQVIAGEKASRRSVKNSNGTKTLDETSLAKARRLVGLKGYVTNIGATVMPASEVIASYHDLWHVEQSFRMSKTDLRARPMLVRTPGRDRGPPDDRVHRAGPLPSGPAPDQAHDPQRHTTATPAALGHRPQQRRRTDASAHRAGRAANATPLDH